MAAMTTALGSSPSVYGVSAGYAPPDYVNAHLLAASTSEQDTFPSGAQWLIARATGAADIWAKVGANPTAAVPADTTDGTASFLLPQGVPIYIGDLAGQKIALLSTSTPVVSLSYYK